MVILYFLFRFSINRLIFLILKLKIYFAEKIKCDLGLLVLLIAPFPRSNRERIAYSLLLCYGKCFFHSIFHLLVISHHNNLVLSPDLKIINSN